MRRCLDVLLILVLLSIAWPRRVSSQILVETVIPPSPCPNVFRYEKINGGEPVGVISVTPSEGSLRVSVVISIWVKLFSTSYQGNLELLENENSIISRIRRGDLQPIKFRIRFPVLAPIPLIAAIDVNGKRICPGASDSRTEQNISFEYQLPRLSVGGSSGGGSYVSPHEYLQVQSTTPSTTRATWGNTWRQTTTYSPYVPTINKPQTCPTCQRCSSCPRCPTTPDYPDCSQCPTHPPPPPPPACPSTPPPRSCPAPVRCATPRPCNCTRPTPAPPCNCPRVTPSAPCNCPRPAPCTTPYPRSCPAATPCPTVQKVSSLYHETIVTNKYEACGEVPISTENVLHGTEAKLSDWPWTSTIFTHQIIENKLTYSYRCGGVLISKKHVVTAAHCIDPEFGEKTSKQDIVVFFGRHNLLRPVEKFMQTKGVEEVIMHEDHSEDYRNPDVAILVLMETVIFTKAVRPVCLWSAVGHQPAIGTVVGWGSDEITSSFSEKPKSIKMSIVSNKACLDSHVNFRTLVNKYTFCAGERDGSGPCSGDSGSGMYVKGDLPTGGQRWMLYGIVSRSLNLDSNGRSTCNLQHYTVFVSVPKLVPWFSDILSTDNRRYG